ncbi:hypothetical protein BDY21DRAFT_355076 [Lineolata rhizophorae]|uniref:Uncharacterized protein n=1 Tax=Lineolata rhizophorae TaxID=578093 RepID=A0A6A6NQW4_9PEZI|nr:hypothetical protein BDY21DRAFT_355076 [Lineolata rhizophorae]
MMAVPLAFASRQQVMKLMSDYEVTLVNDNMSVYILPHPIPRHILFLRSAC